jgi:hypothetical protein
MSTLARRRTRPHLLALGLLFALLVQLVLVGPTRQVGASPPDAEPDLEGTPNLQVRNNLGRQWVIKDEAMEAGSCQVVEGNITPGTRRVLRFTVMVANVGDADINVGDPNEHVESGSNLFEFAECHQHYHFRNYALYELIDASTGQVWRAAKAGFCMIDTDPNPAWLGTPPGPAYYASCGGVGRPGNQGISAGWTDTYRFDLQGQFFVLDGGDGQAPVPAGRYLLRITANPPYAPTPDNPCRYEDPQGLCHALPESNYSDNAYAAEISIPDHLGRGGHGPLS